VNTISSHFPSTFPVITIRAKRHQHSRRFFFYAPHHHPEPINLNPEPINLNPEPINLNPEPKTKKPQHKLELF